MLGSIETVENKYTYMEYFFKLKGTLNEVLVCVLIPTSPYTFYPLGQDCKSFWQEKFEVRYGRSWDDWKH